MSFSASLDPAIMDRAHRVDIATVSGRFAYAEYQKESAPATPAFPVHTFTPAPVPFGECELRNGLMHRKGKGYCGYLLPLNGTVNLLPYRTMTVAGRFSGRWRLAFADEPLAVGEDNVPVGALGSSGGAFHLRDLVRQADLSRARHLVLLLDSERGGAAVDAVTVIHEDGASPPAARGIWIWQRVKVIGHEDEVVGRLVSRGIGRVYLQVGDDPEVFAPFLKKAVHRGIEVYALDGDPGYLSAPEVLLSRIRRIEEYNESHADARYAGFQTDIEPYLNKDFPSRKEEYAEAYLRLLEEIKERSRLPLSVAVPFWFDSLHVRGKSLVQGIMKNADEIVVMSYRTEKDLLLGISAATLSLGEHLGKPVWLGVELAAVPDEEHLELARCAVGAPGALKIGSFWWCEARRYTVPGSRISFRSKMDALPPFLQTPIPFSSFRGWVVHSYEELSL